MCIALQSMQSMRGGENVVLIDHYGLVGCNLAVSVANSKAQLKDKTVCSTVVMVQVPAVSS